MPQLRLHVLGALEVYVDGQQRDIPAGRQRAVLARLLADLGRPLSADTLVEAAWADARPADPPRALRTVISRLRTHLGTDAIRFGSTGYQLVADATDAEEFVDLVSQAHNADPLRARDLLDRSLNLWRGPAFADQADIAAIGPAAERLELLRRDAVDSLASALIQVGEPAAAIPGLDELLDEQPFRESTIELLARALYHAGRQTDALDRLRGYRALLGAELGLDPSPVLTELEGRILGHQLIPPRPHSAGPPAWLDISSAFIGREDDLADLVSTVTTNPVTVVTGPGGVGKSRMVAQALRLLYEDLGLPIAVVELAAVGPGGAQAAIAEELGLRDTDRSPEGSLVEFLAAVPHLIVLDNCEHLLTELPPLVTAIARHCRDVRVLATSRHRLGITGERVLPLSPLRLPDPTPAADTHPAADTQQMAASVHLLVDRVRRLRPSFAISTTNAGQLAELCRRCDGLPLALEIVAAPVATLGVAEVVSRWSEDRISGGLTEVVAWSYQLLRPSERRLLQCLSTCAGALKPSMLIELLEQAMTAFGTDAADRSQLAAALSELIESSLVVGHEPGERFGLLELVRAYAVDRLEASGRAHQVRRAHAEWVRWSIDEIRCAWSHADGAELSSRLSACDAEVKAALRWALTAGEAVLAAEISHALLMCWHWTPSPGTRELMAEVAQAPGAAASGLAAGAFIAAERGEGDRAIALATRVLEASDDPSVTASAQLALAVASLYAGDLPASRRYFTEVTQHPDFAADAHSSLVLVNCFAGDLAAAQEHAAIALATAPASSDHTHAFARYAAGEVAALTDPAAGMTLLWEAVREADRVDAEQVGRVARVALFALLVRSGERTEAAALGFPVIAELRRLSAWNQIWTLLRVLAELLADSGRSSDAAFLLGAAETAPESPPLLGADIERYGQMRDRLAAELGLPVVQRIMSLAAGTPRAQVLGRAEHLLADLGAAR